MSAAETGPLHAIDEKKPSDRPTRARGPRSPTPVGKPVGALIAAVGIVLLLFACLSADLPCYWTENAPSLWGLLAGTLIAGGMLVCYLRFTLRFFLVAVVVVGLSATLASTCGYFRSRTTLEYFCDRPQDLACVIEEGLVGTLVREGVLSTFPSPIVTETRHEYCWIYFRLHADRRVAGLSASVSALAEAIRNPCALPRSEGEVVERYVEALRARFGANAACAAARRSAELVPTEKMRDCFLLQAQRLQAGAPGLSAAKR